MLPVACEVGLKRLQITCDDDNEASRRVIVTNGGVLERSYSAESGKNQAQVLDRSRIRLSLKRRAAPPGSTHRSSAAKIDNHPAGTVSESGLPLRGPRVRILFPEPPR
jgi:hypothetical protein